jgi:hypothetical protein
MSLLDEGVAERERVKKQEAEEAKKRGGGKRRRARESVCLQRKCVLGEEQ